MLVLHKTLRNFWRKMINKDTLLNVFIYYIQTCRTVYNSGANILLQTTRITYSTWIRTVYFVNSSVYTCVESMWSGPLKRGSQIFTHCLYILHTYGSVHNTNATTSFLRSKSPCIKLNIVGVTFVKIKTGSQSILNLFTRE